MNKMEHKIFIIALILFWICILPNKSRAQKAVPKTNPMKVYMHYMPWFETPETIGGWGWHWTMNTMDPDIIGPDGQRQIASHYYPLIGPYASRDKDVIEYHFLLMKLSGVDGVLIDWYGVAGTNGDINDLLKSSDSIVSYTDDFGLEFGVILEDRLSNTINDVKINVTYLKNNYFNRPEYIRWGTDEDPLVGIFGPISFEQPSDWSEILPLAGEEVEFLTLWYESDEAGSNADGEYMWIYQDTEDHWTHLDNFYSNRAPGLKTVGASAYPGFNDFYEEGGAGSGYFYIPHYYGSTLQGTLDRVESNKEHVDMLQLVTFNDFGEGTMFEPTVETGFDYLMKVQAFTGVDYGEAELEWVHRLYVLRKDYSDNLQIQDSLDQASNHLRNLEIDEAAMILSAIDPKTSIHEKVPGKKEQDAVHLYPNPYGGGPLQIDPGQGPVPYRTMQLLDLSGRVVYERSIETRQSSLIINDLQLPDGTYLLLLKNDVRYRSALLVVAK